MRVRTVVAAGLPSATPGAVGEGPRGASRSTLMTGSLVADSAAASTSARRSRHDPPSAASRDRQAYIACARPRQASSPTASATIAALGPRRARRASRGSSSSTQRAPAISSSADPEEYSASEPPNSNDAVRLR